MMRIPAALASAVLVSAGLSSCALLDGVGGSDFDDALELVPGNAISVAFRHRAATAERLGIDHIETGAKKADLNRYAAALIEEDYYVGTQLGLWLPQMSKDAAFSELDIVWEVSASVEAGPITGPVPSIYKMSDDLDLEGVGDDLVDKGYTEDEIGGHAHYGVDPLGDLVVDGSIGPYPVPLMNDVVLVPDEHLMIVGGSPDAVTAAVEVFEDDTDSVTDAGTFDDVVADIDDPEYAQLTSDPHCDRGAKLTPEQIEASGLSDLGVPDAMALIISVEDAKTSSVLAFADDDAAQSDLEGREKYLEEGELLETRESIADVAEWEIARDGNVVTIDYEFEDPGIALDTASRFDAFHACNPG